MGTESMWKSRKFVAYLLADFTWTLLLLLGLWRMEQLTREVEASRFGSVGLTTLLLVMVLTRGFIQVGFIGSQAWLDRYVRLAEITIGKSAEKGIPKDEDKP